MSRDGDSPSTGDLALRSVQALTVRGLRDLFLGAQVGLAAVSPEGRFLEVNPFFAARLGPTVEDLVGREVLELVDPRDHDLVEGTLRRLRHGGGDSEVIEHRMRTADGALCWFRVTVTPVQDTAGEVAQFVAILEDIDEQRRTERELDRRRTLTRIAGSLAAVGGWAMDADTSEMRWSDELFGLVDHEGPDPLPLADGMALFPPGDQALLAAAIERCRRDGSPIDLELEMRTVRGRARWVRVAGEAQRGRDGRIEQVVGMLQDITPLRRANEQAAQLERQLTETLESITDAFFTVDHDWRIRYLNGPGERLLQRSRDELLGRDLWVEFPEAVGSPFHEAYHRAIDEQRTVTLESIYYPPLDTHFEVTAYPSAKGLAVYFRDADERVQRERRMQRLVAQEQDAAARLREVDRIKNAFLSAVSHELRTPLTVVQGMAWTLRERGGELGPRRDDVEAALVEHADRLGQLLDELLDVDRLARGALRSRQGPCDAAAIVRTVVAGSEVAERCELDVPATLPAVLDGAQLERIVVNLLQNVAKYAPDGRVEVQLERAGVSGIALEVRDEGPGIPRAERRRVFEPLYRVEEDSPRPGTGIGLALVAAFAQLHEGSARVVEREVGTTIRVEMPGPDEDQRATTVSTS